MNFTYAENGRILEQRDRGDWKMAYEYDDQGRMVRSSEDHESDGVGDQCRLYVWGEDGNLQSESRDDGCDGAAQRTGERTDANGDGVWDRIEVYEFSDSDHPHIRTGERIDTDARGDWNIIETVVLTASRSRPVQY